MKNNEKLNNYSKLKWVVDKACHDPDYKKNLISHPIETLKKDGLMLENKRIKFLENSANVFHIVIPHTKLNAKSFVKKLPKKPKLSDIQSFLIGHCQTCSSEKSKIMQNPTEYLKSHGVDLPKHVELKIHESKENNFFIVLPRVPEDGVELNQLELEQFSGGDIFSDIGDAFSSGFKTAVNATIGNQNFTNALANSGEALEEGITMPGEEG